MNRRSILLAVLCCMLVGAFAIAADTNTFDTLAVFRASTQRAPAGKTGATLGAVYAATPTLDVPSLATTCTSDTFTVTNAAAGDLCSMQSGTAATEAYTQTCRVSATNTVIVKSCTFGTVDPASQKIFLKTEGVTP